LRRRASEYVRRRVGEVVDDRLGTAGNTRPRVHDRLDDLDRLGRDLLAAVGARGATSGPGAGRAHARGLTPELAAFLNWATGPEGYAAQGHLWLNPPVAVEHWPGHVGVLLVNERIVEQPFVFGALAGLAPGSRIVDVGGSESTVGLSLASLGHEVVVVDPRPHPLAHPSLRHVAAPLEGFADDGGGFDAAVVLSAVEHFGLGHYGAGADGRADLAALRRLRELVRPGGRLVLTVPFAQAASADDFQRVYDDAGLAELLEGWTVERTAKVGRLDKDTWRLEAPSAPPHHGVAMVVATR
jgi:2-polyprenyl-3-methyl-5-hydroxy-6-metoxy-1,4-benzoquinol methylase